ncbi:MAG: hypothetical protein WC539_06405 [Nitrospirota bacterium]
MKIVVQNLEAFCTVLGGHAGLLREITTGQVMSFQGAPVSQGDLWTGSVVYVSPGQLMKLHTLFPRERSAVLQRMFKKNPACFLTSGGPVDSDMLSCAKSFSIPVVKTRTLKKITNLLIEQFAPQSGIHGVFIQIFGLGALIIGKSAIGKSEAALDLVLRGHKLVADDLVLLEKKNQEIVGRALELSSGLLQLRGLGIINIRELYGESAVADSAGVGLVIELQEWQQGMEDTLIGLREQRYRILGTNLPYLRLLVHPRQSMATLIEVAARNQMLKQRGVYTARDVNKKLKQRLAG